VTNPGGVRVDPGLLEDVAAELTKVAADIQQSLGMFSDPAMWTEPGIYAEEFGPAVDVAKQYTDLAQQLPRYVAAITGKLSNGASTFQQLAAGYRELDTSNASGVANAASQQPGPH
jgi:hypothetical protein